MGQKANESGGTQKRRKPRNSASEAHYLKVAVEARAGALHWENARLIDFSDSDLGIELSIPLLAGTLVVVHGELPGVANHRNHSKTKAEVRWCMVSKEGRYRAGLLLEASAARGSYYYHAPRELADSPELDYYDALQLSPKADPDMIHRAFRLLAQRYHPDNSETGSEDAFKILLEAYKVLSDPEKRAAYDVERHSTERQRWRIFSQPLNGGMDEERQKRHGILGLLYARRIRSADSPTMTIHELEDLLGCPREHLEASLWFLMGKGWCTRSDNGRYSITVTGFEQAEDQMPRPARSEHLLLDAAKG